MKKPSKAKVSAKKSPAKKTHMGYRVLATLPDGVKLLAPKTKPTHFTSDEIRQTIRRVLRERAASGRS